MTLAVKATDTAGNVPSDSTEVWSTPSTDRHVVTITKTPEQLRLVHRDRHRDVTATDGGCRPHGPVCVAGKATCES